MAGRRDPRIPFRLPQEKQDWFRDFCDREGTHMQTFLEEIVTLIQTLGISREELIRRLHNNGKTVESQFYQGKHTIHRGLQYWQVEHVLIIEPHPDDPRQAYFLVGSQDDSVIGYYLYPISFRLEAGCKLSNEIKDEIEYLIDKIQMEM